MVHFFGERLVGRDSPEPQEFYGESFQSSLHFGRRGLVINTLSGIDIALWDLKGKREGQPLVRLLGAGGVES